MICAIAQAQLFTQELDEPIVNTPADSRSVNFADVNGDGWEDVFITNGTNPGTVNLLFLNNGDGTFTQIVDDSIVSDAKPFDGATFADADNDGDLDAFVVTWYGQKNNFYTNNGDGTFYSESGSVLNGGFTYSETASWGDYNNDGFVDVYVSNSGGDKRNILYKNLGDGSFEKIAAGLQSTDTKFSRSVNWIDFDNDNDQDLFVSNESEETNSMYINDGTGLFSALTSDPLVNAIASSMSSSWGDIDNDLDMDVFISNSKYFEEQNNQLFINNGDGSFTQVMEGAIVSDGGCSYGSNFADYDNDGDLDLVVMNGYCGDGIVNFLYTNDGNGNFTRDFSSIADLSTPCSYGGAWGDVNNDGFLELIMATCDDGGADETIVNKMYRNNGNGNNWIKIHLTGEQSNASCIGAKLFVHAVIDGNAVWQMREISAQSGYCGQNSLIAHFGLGNATLCDSIIIKFPSGKDTVILNVPVNQQIEISEFAATEIIAIEQPAMALHCYPNPATDFLVITIPEFLDTEFQISITDATQHKVFQKNYQGNISELQIDISALQITKGYYTIRLTSQLGVTSTQIVLF